MGTAHGVMLEIEQVSHTGRDRPRAPERPGDQVRIAEREVRSIGGGRIRALAGRARVGAGPRETGDDGRLARRLRGVGWRVGERHVSGMEAHGLVCAEPKLGLVPAARWFHLDTGAVPVPALRAGMELAAAPIVFPGRGRRRRAASYGSCWRGNGTFRLRPTGPAQPGASRTDRRVSDRRARLRTGAPFPARRWGH